MNDLNRQIAELLGWQAGPINGSWWECDGTYTEDYSPSEDANQAQAAVREWANASCVSERAKRQRAFGEALGAICAVGMDYYFSAVTATPEQLCKALIAASREDTGA